MIKDKCSEIILTMKLLTKIGIANLLAIGILLSASSLKASAENNSQDLIVANSVENKTTTNQHRLR